MKLTHITDFRELSDISPTLLQMEFENINSRANRFFQAIFDYEMPDQKSPQKQTLLLSSCNFRKEWFYASIWGNILKITIDYIPNRTDSQSENLQTVGNFWFTTFLDPYCPIALLCLRVNTGVHFLAPSDFNLCTVSTSPLRNGNNKMFMMVLFDYCGSASLVHYAICSVDKNGQNRYHSCGEL